MSRETVLKLSLAVALLGCATGLAWADATVVTDVTIEYPVTPHSLHQAPVHQVVTSSYRDDKVRMQSETGDAVIYSLGAGTATWLHAGTKTFTVLPIGQLPAVPESADDWRRKLGTAPRQDTAVDVKVKPQSGEVKVAGLVGHPQSVHATVSLTTVDSGRVGGSAPFFPGGGSAGGGQAGGGFNNGPIPPQNTGLGSIPLGAGGGGREEEQNDDPSADVDGEYWVADAPWPNINPLPWYTLSMPANRLTLLLAQPVAQKLGGFPVSSRVTLHLHWTSLSPESRHGVPDEVVVTTQVRSINQDAVSNSLLYPPADYRQDNSILSNP